MTDQSGIERQESTGFKVVFTKLTLVGFVIIMMLVLRIADPSKSAADNLQLSSSLGVELTWDPNNDQDLDLWVKAPGDRAVGYSNRSGKVFNLLRDDLGFAGDLSKQNFELAFTRGLVDGEYIVNVHLYKTYNPPPPVEAHVTIWCSPPENQDTRRVLFQRDIELDQIGQELTVIRFAINERCEVDPGSVNAIPIQIRSGN